MTFSEKCPPERCLEEILIRNLYNPPFLFSVTDSVVPKSLLKFRNGDRMDSAESSEEPANIFQISFSFH